MSNTTMTSSRRRMLAVAFATAIAGCSSTRIATQHHEVRSTGRIAYYHATFGAGPTVITRDDGRVLDERRYEPFGAAIDSPTGAVDFARDPHNLLNKETDVATGWSDHGARWLAPETARWLTPDPPLKAPDPKHMSEPWGLHPYQYAAQNPVLFWDPDGRDEAPIFMFDCRGVCNENGLVPAPRPSAPARSEEPSTARKAEGFFESVVSPIVTTQAGTWAIAEKFVPEAKALAKPLDKGSTALSLLLAVTHGVQYQFADTEEEQNEHAGGFFLGVASLYPVTAVIIAGLSIIDPDINKHVGTPIDVEAMFRETRHQARMEYLREHTGKLPPAKDWHDPDMEKFKTPTNATLPSVLQPDPK
jgi:RHS repeat-associated protein